MVFPPLNWTWTPHLATNILKTLTKPFGVQDHYVDVPVGVAIVIGLMVVMMVLGLVNTMSIVAVGLKSV